MGRGKPLDPDSPRAIAIREREEARKAYLEHCARANAAHMKLLTARGDIMGAMAGYHAIGGKAEDIDTLDLIVREIDRQIQALKNEAVTGRAE